MCFTKTTKYTGKPVLFLLMLCMGLLCGCESLVNDLDQDKLPKVEAKLAVSCYISPQTPRFEAIITESQPLFGPANYNPVFVENAEVILADDVSQVRLIFDDSLKHYAADSSAFKIVAGKTYTLTVNDGKRIVKAKCTVPFNAVKVMDLNIEKAWAGYGTDSLASFRFSWEDVKGQSNFYAVRGAYTLEETVPRFYPETGDITPFRYTYRYDMYSYYRAVYNDINLDGIKFNAPAHVIYSIPRRIISYLDKKGVERTLDNDPRLRDVRVEVMCIDEHYYKFKRSLENNDDNPFVEPTLVYTNIEGGLGIFASFNAVGKTVNP
ncbi:DUF4249 domain-containing protein [Dyadobacter sp. LJ53]|uniref:DUF4249 domain-containing protein n=1 Tax=Dyadobacter chenwenxiniae TaxID=2906456 RepID=UPI001F306359|nr:DUF4249 domain-containing protein [Dyadobacter chenwenxiniae]MCF0049356.1 DUF4249 domain-containing protein [Dyadobacter chenwenxiniae]